MTMLRYGKIQTLNSQENKGLQTLHVEHVSDKKFVWLDVNDITDDIPGYQTGKFTA